MSVKVLKSVNQVEQARRLMNKRGVSCLAMPSDFHMNQSFIGRKVQEMLRIFNQAPEVPVGDKLKSWDVWMTLEFIENKLTRNATVLDIGGFASEMACSLYKAGFRKLSSLDLNPNIRRMPFSDKINYVVSDFMNAPFPDNSFDAVTAISVIEHGFMPDLLLKEMARLIRKGGYFIASTDYWREKIDTKNQRVFDMDWRIFSEQEIRDFIDGAKAYGFILDGEADYSVGDKVINCMNQSYTFIWFALKKLNAS